MLDEKYDFPVPSHPGNTDIYTLDCIGGRQVVITSLPAGKTGVTAAAVATTRVLADFRTGPLVPMRKHLLHALKVVDWTRSGPPIAKLL